MTSPYREPSFYNNKSPEFVILPFSKQALITTNRKILDLDIDLFRPKDIITSDFMLRQRGSYRNTVLLPPRETSLPKLLPTHDLSPLCLFRNLTTLTIIGMCESYQPVIWEAVWLMTHLKDLDLRMEEQAERISYKDMAAARLNADAKPSTSQV